MGFLIFNYKLDQEKLDHEDTKFALQRAQAERDRLKDGTINVCKALGISYIEDPSSVVAEQMTKLATLMSEFYKANPGKRLP